MSSSSASWAATGSLPAAPKYVDAHGCQLSATNPLDAGETTQRAAEHNNKRVDRWMKMLVNWEATRADYPKLKRRVRAGGIPAPLRGHAWQLLLGSRELMLANPTLYRQLLKGTMDPELQEIARRDLGRTFTTNVLFNDAHSADVDDFQQALYRVLHAYAVYDSEVGYCQGMGFLAATLLSQMDEEAAFFAFVTLLRHQDFRVGEMYLPGFPKLQKAFFVFETLLRHFAPRLSDHLECVQVSFFASRWFMTLFSNVFPLSQVLPLWDCFLVERWKVLFRVALALLLRDESQLLGMGMEALMQRLKHLHEGQSIPELLAAANALKVTNRQLELLEAAAEAADED